MTSSPSSAIAPANRPVGTTRSTPRGSGAAGRWSTSPRRATSSSPERRSGRRRDVWSISGRSIASWNARAAQVGYADSRKGQQLVEAFAIAFNAIVAQRETIAATPRTAPVAAAAPQHATVAAATVMKAAPSTEGQDVRSLMVGTTLTPTGRREGAGKNA
jgi:hypothetical protein